MDETSPWDLQRPDLLVADLARHDRFDRPATHLVRLDNRAGRQEFAGWTTLWGDPPDDVHPDRTRLAEQALDRLGTPGVGVVYGERPLVVPVVVRPGPAVWTIDEKEVMLALRYAGNTRAFLHEFPVVVTTRGWWMTELDVGASEPRATWSDQSLLTMTSAGRPTSWP